MKRTYGLESVTLHHGPMDRSDMEDWLARIELSDPNVVVMRYPEATGIGGITQDSTWLIVDDLIRWLESCE